MAGLLAPILAPLRRLAGNRGPGELAAADRRMARRLADAIDRAMALDLWEHADRLAAVACRQAPGSSRLAEPVARLRLARCEPEAALAVIDGARIDVTPMPSSLRLVRAACLLCLGSRTEAQLDLHRWAAKRSAPLEARLLLALLEWQDHDDAAIETLHDNLEHAEDPRTLAALMLIAVERGRQGQAELWAHRLRTCAGAEAAVPCADLMLRSLGMAGIGTSAEPSPQQTSALAMELVAFEPAIAALVEAQRRSPHLPTARLLRRALEEALPDLDDAAGAYLALARLCLLLGEEESARDLARRGLDGQTMSAALALLLRQLSGAHAPEAEADHIADAPVPQATDDSILATIGKHAAPLEKAA